MSDLQKTITRDTLIPIGLALALAGGIFYLGVISNQIASNTGAINEIKSWISNAPTQYQFDTLKSDISDIKADIKDLKVTLTK